MRKWFPARTRLAAAALGLVVALAPSPARAGVAEGDKAPDFAGAKFFNTSSVDLRSLKGRVVLLEIFRTW